MYKSSKSQLIDYPYFNCTRSLSMFIFDQELFCSFADDYRNSGKLVSRTNSNERYRLFAINYGLSWVLSCSF